MKPMKPMKRMTCMTGVFRHTAAVGMLLVAGALATGGAEGAAQSGEIRLRMIAVLDEADAEAIQGQLAAGAPFDELARQFSVDPSSEVGGALGALPRNGLREDFSTALRGVAPGQTSPIFPMDNGFVLLHVYDAEDEAWMEARNRASEAFESGDDAGAEELLKEAVDHASALGAGDPRHAQALAELASFYQYRLALYPEALALYQRTLEIQEQVLGAVSPTLANTLNNIAENHFMSARFAEAERFYNRALAIYQRANGYEDAAVAGTLVNLARLYESQNQFARSQTLYAQSLSILENLLGASHIDLVGTLASLAFVHHAQSHYPDAARLYRRALGILEPEVGVRDPNVVEMRRALDQVLRNQPLF
jgi:tetratricopeptide (TPR) repeat protein